VSITISLEGRTALVTGAAHGFGRAIAETLARAGATVWAGDILEDELAETARRCGPRAIGRRLDVTDRAMVQEFVADMLKALGRIDILERRGRRPWAGRKTA